MLIGHLLANILLGVNVSAPMNVLISRVKPSALSGDDD